MTSFYSLFLLMAVLLLSSFISSCPPNEKKLSKIPIIEETSHKISVPKSNVVMSGFAKSNSNPGVKVTMTQDALSYILSEMLPQLKAILSNIHIDDIKNSVKTPIGHVDLSLTNVKVSEVSLSDASLQISNTGLIADISNVHFAASGSWKYKEKSFPHISDHGSIDVSIGMSHLIIKTSTKLNTAFKSGLQVSVDSVDFSFHSFSIKLHGGASWLYNVIVSLLKGDIEKSIHKAVANGVPPAVTKSLQEKLDEQNLIVPISHDVNLSFAPREVSFVERQRLTLGAAGDFVKENVPPYPHEPASTPDIVNNKMVQVFLSDHVLSSAGYTFDVGGLMQATVTPKDIPDSWPLQLNTSYLPFRLAAPGLYGKYPDREMEILFRASEEVPPTAEMSQKNGIQILAIGDALFKVIQPNATVDAFTLTLKLNFTLGVGVQENIISGEISLKNLTLGVKDSHVGDVSISFLDTTLNFLVSNVIVPILNTFTQKGFPIPQLEQLALIDPQVTVMDHHIQIYSDFTLKI